MRAYEARRDEARMLSGRRARMQSVHRRHSARPIDASGGKQGGPLD